MDGWVKTLLVGLGGAVGANCRYWIGAWLSPWLENRWGAGVWGTFFINVTGSLIIGMFMGLSLELNWNQNWRLLVAIGVLGGYTTYSTFAYEAVGLLAARETLRALLYIEGTALGAVLCAWLGVVGARVLLGGRG